MDQNPFDAPLYAWLLDATRVFGGPVVTGAHVLGLILICLNTLLVFGMLVSSTNVTVAFFGTALAIMSPYFVGMHTVAMSEPLFISLMLMTVLLFCKYFERRSLHLLFATAFALGLTMLTRFAGTPLLLAIAAILLLDRPRPLYRRLLDVAIVAAVSGAIFLSWAVGSKLAGGNSIGRELRLYGHPDAELWQQGLTTMTTLLLPTAIPEPLRIILLIAVFVGCGGVVWVYCRRIVAGSAQGTAMTFDRLPLVLGLFAIFYCLSMVVAVHIEANLPLNGRYALPLYIAGVMTVAVALGSRHRVRLPRVGHRALLVVVAIILASHMVRSSHRVWISYSNGIGYNTVAWRSAPEVQFVKNLPADATVYSNGADILAFQTGRRTRYIPFRFNRRTQLEDPINTLEDQISSIRRSIENGDTYIVFMDEIDWRFYILPEDELAESVPLALYAELPNGRVYVGAETLAGDRNKR